MNSKYKVIIGSMYSDEDELRHRTVPQLNPQNVPAELHNLLPLAQKWGIADDITRERAILKASRTELEAVAKAVLESEQRLNEWLCGPESSSATPSREYVAFTALSVVADIYS